MVYQQVFGDLEDFAQELKVAKAKKAWFRISNEQTEIKRAHNVALEDGTKERQVLPGVKYTAKITLTAFGYLNPSELDQKTMGASLNPPKPDSQLVFVAPIAQKDCFVDPSTGSLDAEEVAAFDKEVETNWKAVISEVKKIWDGPFFEGVGSIISGENK